MAVHVGAMRLPAARGADGAAPAWRRARPLWLVAALSVATLNLYGLYWIYATWRELKAERADASMKPGWHAISILGPIHGIFQYYRHMQAIRDLARASGVATSFSPLACVLLWLATTIGGFGAPLLAWQGAALPHWFTTVVALSQAPLIVWAQATLNRAWQARPGGAPAYRISPLVWPILSGGALIQAAPLLAAAAP